MVRRWTIVWGAAACLAGSWGASAAEVRFTVSTRETFVGVPIQVQVIVEDATDHDPPDFPEVDGADVRYIGPSTQQFTSITMQGRVVRNTVTYSYSVIPTRPGTLVIPSITVSADGESRASEPAKIVVKKSDTGDLLFLEIIGQRDSVYVGEPIDVTLEIWLKPFTSGQVRLSEVDMWRVIDTQNSVWGPFIENLQHRQPDVTYRTDTRETSSGRRERYFVYSLEQRVWPERAGVFEADGVRVLAQYPLRVRRNRFMLLGGRYEVSESRPISAGVSGSSITVKAPPLAGQPAGFNGAVGRYRMTASAAPLEVSVGDPITLTLTIRGEGRLDLLRAPRLGAQESLTADFRVPDEELAGEVVGKTKTFSQSIRAKHDRVTEIPPIEFSYFDPSREEYVVLKSQPIPISVRESSRLAVSEVVARSGSSAARTQLTLAESGLLANYDDLDRLLSQQSPSVGRGTLGVVASGPLAFAACALIQRRRERLANDSGFARRRLARKTAMETLRAARGSGDATTAAGEVLSAVTGYVADRCGLGIGGVTRGDAVDRLRAGGVSESVVAEVDVLLGDCEGARYGAVDEGDAGALVDRATRVVNTLETSKF